MKKQNDEEKGRQIDDVAPEYDLKDKPHVRGKYYEAYQAGHELRIKESDGSITVRYFTLEEGAVLLEPEVKAYFPDSKSVNRALRSLIDLIPEKRKQGAADARKRLRKRSLSKKPSTGPRVRLGASVGKPPRIFPAFYCWVGSSDRCA